VLAPMETSGEEGRRAGGGAAEVWNASGWRCPFIGAGRGARAVGRGG
jgi:hypothetical protein